MGCFPSFNRTESWIEAERGLKGNKCHICDKTENVRRGRIHQTTCGGHEEVDADSPAYWEICVTCHASGWQVPDNASMGHIIYGNISTGEIKSVSS